MSRTNVTIAGVEFKNPVMVASGTFGSGEEFSDFVDLNRLGAVVTKGVANVPWPGNPTPRIAEVYGGMLNAIGLQNPGIDVFAARDIPWLRSYIERGRARNKAGLQPGSSPAGPGQDSMSTGSYLPAGYRSVHLSGDSVMGPAAQEQTRSADGFGQAGTTGANVCDTRIIVNVCGRSVEDYCEVVERLADEPVDMLEINISCPNVKEGGIAFGQDPKAVEAITRACKSHAKQPIIMKLSPNVTDITVMAKAAEAGGADALSLINTLTGMKIDVERRTFALANKTGGLSGPALHPVAVRMVYQAAQAVRIPIIGMGGIMNAADALELILAGASAVSVGTANFTNPAVTMEIVEGIEAYLERQGIADIRELIGAVHE